MKSVLFFALLALVLANVLSCDPDGDNEPVCTSKNLNKMYRNFWDPTHYWLCQSDGAAAKSVQCKPLPAFNYTINKCVDWDKWTWTPPCPTDTL